MLPKAYMNPESWMYYFEKRSRAARKGKYLPTLDDLYCGMPFFGGSLAADVEAWSEQVIPCLADKDQEIPQNPVQIALERLSVSARLSDLQLADDEIIKYNGSAEMFSELERASRRLTFYRAVSGDESARGVLFDNLMFRIRWLTCESAGLGGGLTCKGCEI